MTIAQLSVRIGTDLSAFDRVGPQIEGKLRSAKASLRNVGRAMTVGLTVPIVTAGAAIIKLGSDFEKSMNRVQALTGESGALLAKLRDQAKELGATTVFSASQASDAMGFLAQAGFKANQIFAAMPATLDLAAAAQTDLAQTADLVSNIMQGFNKEAGETRKVADVLAQTFTNANTDLIQLGDAFKYAGPVANAAGLSFEETSAILGLFGNAGIQASLAGTQLRQSLARLIDPPKKAAEALSRLQIQTKDSKGELLPLTAIFGQLAEKGAGAADIFQIFGLRAAAGAASLNSALQKTPDLLQNFASLVTNSAGRSAEIAEIQMRGFAGATIALKSALEGLSIAITESGVLDIFTAIVQRVTKFVRKLTETNPEILKFGFLFAGLVAAIGPVALVISALISPIGAIVAAVAAFGAVAATLYSEWDNVKQYLEGPLQGAFNEIVITWRSIQGDLKEVWETVKSVAMTVFNALAEYYSRVLAVYINIFNEGLAKIRHFWQVFGGDITTIVKGTFKNLGVVIETALKVVAGVFEVFGALLAGDFSGAWKSLEGVIIDTMTGATKIVLINSDIMLGALSRVLTALPGHTSDALAIVTNAARDQIQAWLRQIEGDVAGSNFGPTWEDFFHGAEETADGTGKIILKDWKDHLTGMVSATGSAADQMKAKLEKLAAENPLKALRLQGTEDSAKSVKGEKKRREKEQDDSFTLGTPDTLVGLEAVKNAREQFETEQEAIAKASEDMQQRFRDSIGQTIDTLTGGLQEMIEGSKTFGSVIKSSIGSAIGNLLSTIGTQAIRVGLIAIGIGKAIAGIQAALTSLNPFVAIGAGVALVALGAAARGALSGAASGGGGGINTGSFTSGYSVNPNDRRGSYPIDDPSASVQQVQVALQPAVLPNGDLVFSQSEGNRRSGRFGTRQF